MKKNIIFVTLFLSIFILLPNYKNKAYHQLHLDSNCTILNSLEHDINNDSMSDDLLITTDNNFYI